ncbi:hypothetical protein FA15DRAFT_658168 [Coprinopsis marcescibilis]|uniref:F-box domain-containing protein n=1 Tax=Coprinopsis marcescibilis TaxID=230819 RepID=A0A5C3KML7_COPMA|nr:hypothetical protein FA15DRAFT_658168 [Coprinopsis marcescibilis]
MKLVLIPSTDGFPPIPNSKKVKKVIESMLLLGNIRPTQKRLHANMQIRQSAEQVTQIDAQIVELEQLVRGLKPTKYQPSVASQLSSGNGIGKHGFDKSHIQVYHQDGHVQTRQRSRLARIIELEDLIRGLKSKRNQLSATHQLPPELLSRIFVFYKPDFQTPPLGAPRRVPLDVSVWGQTFSSSTEDGILLLRCLNDHAFRFNTLFIKGISGDIKKWVSRLTTAAPLLTALHIINMSSNIGALFPAWIFARSTPQLRKLQLNGCIPDWSSTIFSKGSRMTSLRVVYTLKWAPGQNRPPALKAVLQALGNMPQLLYLELGMNLAGSSSANRRPSVRLPALQTLKLTGEIKVCSAILSRLQLPTFANIVLSMSLKPVSNHWYLSAATDLAMSCVSSWLSNPLANPNNTNTEPHYIQSLRVHAQKPHPTTTPETFKFEAWLTHVSLPPPTRHSQPSPNLSIELTNIKNTKGFEIFREHFLPALPLEKLKCLDMHYNFGSILRLNPFASFPIEELYIHGLAGLDCLSQCLGSDPGFPNNPRHPPSTGPTSVTYFCALRTLCVVDMGITVFDSDSPDCCVDFGDVLKLRRSLGYGLKSIKLIDRRNLPASVVESWRDLKVADEVHWDGVRELWHDEILTWEWVEEDYL